VTLIDRTKGGVAGHKSLWSFIMPHEIESMAYFGQQTPWHGLGAALTADDLYDWQRACTKAGLDWEVESIPLVTADTQAKVSHVGIRRKSDGRVLGVVGPRYAALQNREAFRWFQPVLDSGEAALHTAGSLRQGSRVWVLARLNRDPVVIAPGDEVEKFILLSHGHDGSLAVRVGFTPVRVVCANTLAMAHGSDASKLIRVKHTRDVLENLANVREVMDLANQQFEATAEQYRLLARKAISQADLREYVKKVLRIEGEAKPSARVMNIIDTITGLMEAGRGNDLPSVRGTFWAGYNAVTDYLSHHHGLSESSRLNSLWFGENAGLNRHALGVAVEMATAG
jgi:phage/plasmid-like protein (TIGR03299 family)